MREENYIFKCENAIAMTAIKIMKTRKKIFLILIENFLIFVCDYFFFQVFNLNFRLNFHRAMNNNSTKRSI